MSEEQEIQAGGAGYVILSISWRCALRNRNVFNTTLRRASDRDEPGAVDDKRDANLVANHRHGNHVITGPEKQERKGRLAAISKRGYQLPAPHPINSLLSSAKLRTTFDRYPE